MKLRHVLRLSGIDIKRVIRSRAAWKTYRSNRRQFLDQALRSKDDFPFSKDYPCLWDRYDEAGVAKGHYFFQDLSVARKIYAKQPSVHVDVGSRVDGFVSHLAVFTKVIVYDVRGMDSSDSSIAFHVVDLMEGRPDLRNSIPSLSCLHALEHFGLGRYGDPINPDGHLKGFSNLVAMLCPGGNFYFSVPISERQRIEFDAHRVFSLPYLRDMFSKHSLQVVEFEYVDDDGYLKGPADLNSVEADQSFGLNYGCGIFVLTK